MPQHRQITYLHGGGCSVCGAYGGALTTDCPGEKIDFNKQKEVYETNLDYTDARGWHQGEPMQRRTPRFEKGAAVELPSELLGQPTGVTKVDLDPVVEELSKIVGTAATDWKGEHTPRWTSIDAPQGALRVAGCSCGWQCPSGTQDSDTAFTLHAAYAYFVDPDGMAYFGPTNTANNARGDHRMQRKDELAGKAIAWVLADRIATQHSADLEQAQEEADAYLATRGRRFLCGHIAPDVGGGDWCKPCGASRKIADAQQRRQIAEREQPPDPRTLELLGKLEHVSVDFHLVDQHAVACDDEFRQAARKLVEALERGRVPEPPKET
jgi:hypothetical protein